jgi:hypothetical protein
MALIGPGGVTLSVPTRILWYGNCFYFKNLYLYLFPDLYVHMCFNRASFVNGLT